MPSTIILVHRQPLLEQWRSQIGIFLDRDEKSIGQIGGGKRKLTGQVDVAMLQSLSRKNTVDDIVADYGQVIIDECHHLPAISFERILSEIKAKYVVGLTATPQRRDGLFLSLPVSWKGTLVQYTGRLHRLHAGKYEVRIVDYVDGKVPMLAYRAVGYQETQLNLKPQPEHSK